jgi:glucose-6-phosphate isomerase
MLKTINPTQTKAWKKLEKLFSQTKNAQMRTWFENAPLRAENFSIYWNDLYFDYSKNRIDQEILDALFELADECGVPAAIQSMFSGEKINATENRAVLHTALRRPVTDQLILDGKDIIPEIHKVLDRMAEFADKIRSGEWKGYSGKRIKNIVNIGIGGSDLGPQMVAEALKPLQDENLNLFFVSNVDPSHIHQVLQILNPEETLFLIASKTFTTQETMLNAQTAKQWLLDKTGREEAVALHFAAMSTNTESVKAFGIDPENMFEFWNFVGGRFSLWSAIGLPVMIGIGPDNFKKLLEGANAMDVHFSTEKKKNIPLIMALLGIWYQNFYGSDTLAILPYDQYMHRFPAYLQQTDMESNGKSIDRAGNKIIYQTGPVVFGESGTNGQHAFYQLMHQGKKLIPADFIAFVQSYNDYNDQHLVLFSNFIAQTEALMHGKTVEEVLVDFGDKPPKNAEKLLPFKIFDGNRPTNSFVFKKLTPFNLGALIAAYEHKIYVQGIIWNVFSFDQWGVELGKVLAKNIQQKLTENTSETKSDSSTENLIDVYKKWQ